MNLLNEEVLIARYTRRKLKWTIFRTGVQFPSPPPCVPYTNTQFRVREFLFYTFEIEVLQKLREEKINEQKTSIQAEINITAKTLQSIKSRLVGYQSEIGAINSVAQAKMALSEIEEQSKNENFFTKLWRGITGKPQITKVKSDLE